MLGSVLTALVALASHGAATQSHSAAPTRATTFPATGIVVPGQSIGGISLGMTQAEVAQRWGVTYTICGSCGPLLTWIYEYPGGNAALGAAVKFSTASTPVSAGGTSLATKAATTAATSKRLAAKALTAKGVALRAAATAKTLAAKAATAKAAHAANAAAAELAATKAAAAAKTATASALAAKLAAAKAAAAATSAAAALAASMQGSVVAVFTLGSPVGWGIKGVMMGDPVSNVYNLFGNTGNQNCIGYSALTVNIGSSTTSFYAANGVIYGYALTAASQPPCQ
jgi:hypothetical protein